MEFHKSTNLGIEIEICVEKEKYKTLQTKREKNQETIYRYPEGEDPFRTKHNSISVSNRSSTFINNSNKSEELRDILLTNDITCKCNKKTHNSAEIVSPRMLPDKLPSFYSFLKEKLMDDMRKIKQAKTCGIHIHWSNKELQLYPDDNNYIFEFIRLFYHLRKYFNTKVIQVGFSGRLHNYDEIEQKPLNIDLPIPIVDGKIFISKNVEVNIDKDITLSNIEEQLLDTDLMGYQWRQEKTIDRINVLFSYLEEKKRDVYLILYFVISISNKESFLTRRLGFKKNDYNNVANLKNDDLKYFVKFTYDNLEELIFNSKDELFEEVEKIYDNPENPKNRFGSFTLEGNIRKDWDLQKLFKESIREAMEETRILMYSFSTLMSNKKNHAGRRTRTLDYLPIELRDVLFRETSEKLSSFPDIIDQKIIIENLRKNFYKSGMSLYDLKGFHMEMRIFSLDALFERKRRVTALDIVQEINSFVEKTEYFFVKILEKLNRTYNPSIKGIPEEVREEYNQFFLMDKTYTLGSKAVKNKLKELFGIKRNRGVNSNRSIKTLSLRTSPKGSKSRSRKKRK